MVTRSLGASPDDTEWTAIVTNDPFAGFIYAVVSTGVACRPVCPSRKPNRENVWVFETLCEAETAGYRACKRCARTADTLAQT